MSKSELHVQESTTREGASISEFHKHPASKGVQNTSSLEKFFFAQKSSNTPSGMPYREGDKGKKGYKMPKTIDLTSTDIRRSARLDNKLKQKYGLFAKLSLLEIGTC